MKRIKLKNLIKENSLEKKKLLAIESKKSLEKIKKIAQEEFDV